MKLFHEIKKNLKIIFRSWTSIMLLILGPLMLILLIGYAFSGTDIHDINLGVLSENPASIEPILTKISEDGNITYYSDITLCTEDMKLEKVHICIDFGKDFISKDKIPTGDITFYFDNTRSKITNEIVSNIKDVLGVTSEEISLEATTTIFDNIQKLVLFLKEKSSDIKDLQDESENIKQDLTVRKQKLIETREEFLPSYIIIKDLQDEINSLTENFSDNILKTKEQISTIKDIINNIENYNENILKLINAPSQVYIGSGYASFSLPFSDDFEIYNISEIEILNISGTKLTISYPDEELIRIQKSIINISNLTDEQILGILITALDYKLKELNTNLNYLETNIDNIDSKYIETKEKFNSLITEIDNIKILLDEEIQNTDTYIQKIDIANQKITIIKEELDKGLDNLAFINPDIAEKIIKPIIESYEALEKDLKNIKQVFPLLLSVVIIFISILFSNIVTLSEIHSKAFFRNLIAPVKDINFTLGLIITNYIVVFFQILILLLVAKLQFELEVFTHFKEILVVFTLLSLCFILIGMIFAYLFKNEQTSILTTTFIALGFFLFSDVVTPLELMPKLAAIVASLNPIVISTKVLKQIIIFNLPLKALKTELLTLTLYVIIAFILMLFAAKLSRSRR